MSRLPITPVMLTWNEAANIERSLARLGWAERVVVVDSGSTDGTRELALRHANVRLLTRPFDLHCAQWEFAVRHPDVDTDWVLALDADYVLTPGLIEELERVEASPGVGGFRVRFRYCVDGRPLRASLYPPVVVLFDRRRAHYVQDGHTQRLLVEGEVRDLPGEILHDDRKPLERFVEAQGRYARLEAARIRSTRWAALPWSGRVRRLRVVAPWLAPFWALIGRGVILDGRAGIAYARQRWIAEAAIARALSRSASRSSE